MLLSPNDAKLFFKLHRSLMHFVNQRLGILPDIASPEEIASLPPETRLEISSALFDDVDLIESFVDENSANLSDEEADIVLSWRHHISGKFYAFRQLKKYMVFLSSSDQPFAYGVVALTQPFEDLIGPYLPVMTDATLLPFKDKIIYDGLLSSYNISFGGGIKRMLNDSYRAAKERQGIVTSLPIQSIPNSAAKTKKKTATKKKATTRKKNKKTKASVQLYQFKITLNESRPAIWRRIQVTDCTLDMLNEHIQTAMGWTNSHLHQFVIDGKYYGAPQLLNDGFSDFECVDSTVAKISDIVPNDGEGFRFRYVYDFGDGWEHEVLFEGCPQAEPGQRYPLCLEGQRACPPEDVGGVWGYMEYLEALADPKHDRHDELLEWSGPFDPDAFDAADQTQFMRQGLPVWF